MTCKELGRIVREKRCNAGLTLPELARLSDLPKSTISKIENGKGNPSLSTIGKISDALQIMIMI